MELNLLPVLNYEGKRLEIDTTLKPQMRQGDNFRLITPVTVKGQIVNIGGSLELDATGTAAVELTCDRCLSEFEATLSFPIEERYKKEDAIENAESNPDIVILDGDSIDLESVVYDALVMELPSKVLCREDCKGLCASCGRNLNLEDCSCDNRPTDPRFDVLDKLL